MARSSSGMGVALFSSLLGLALLAVGFSTNEWSLISVNRTQLLTDPTVNKTLTNISLNCYARRRGLFRECFDGVNASLLPQDLSFMDLLAKCIPVEYMIPEKTSLTDQLSTLYWIRIHLMRTEVASFCLSMLFLLAGISTGVASCWHAISKQMWSSHSKWAGVLIFAAAFFNALGMALYHGCDYLERNSITDTIFPLYFQQTWPAALTNATTRTLGYSYVLCWVSVLCASVAALTFFIIGWMRVPKEEAEEVLYDNPAYENVSAASNSRTVASNSRYVPEDLYLASIRSSSENDTYQCYIPRAEFPMKATSQGGYGAMLD